MPNTRVSTRSDDVTPKKGEVTAGTKRKADATSPKRNLKAAKQSTIEETLAGDNTADPPKSPSKDVEMKDTVTEDTEEKGDKEQATAEDDETNEKDGDHVSNGIKDTDADKNDAVQESSQREKKIASSILEKGIVYFFARNRVGVDDSDSVGDLQRTYFVLRPLPLGTKLGEPIDNVKEAYTDYST